MMALTENKPVCKHKDTRPMSAAKKARIASSVEALQAKGRISGDEFYAKLDKALAKKK